MVVLLQMKIKVRLRSVQLKNVAYIFGKLHIGERCYIGIRSYKKSGKETLYSAWSKAKVSGKIKK